MTTMPRLNLTASALCLALPLLGASAAHAAPLQNGDFQQGLLGWQTAGDASVQGGASPQLVLGTATTWTDDDAPDAAGAHNLSGQDPLIAGDASGLEAWLGLPTSAFGPNAYEGSAAMQTFDVQAGDRVSFTWQLATRDNGTHIAEPDAAWLVLGEGGPAAAQLLGDTATLSMQAQAGGWLASSAMQHSFIAMQSGPLTLAWAISDTNSFGNTSLLRIGQVTVTAVPEPGVIALVLAGVFVTVAARQGRSGRA